MYVYVVYVRTFPARPFSNVPGLLSELVLPNMELTVEECVNRLVRLLETSGILGGGPVDPSGSGLPMPDGDEIVDLHLDARYGG